MDEKKNNIVTKKGKTTCACGNECNCGCGCNHRCGVLWWIAGIFLLFLVFAIGVKAGEFRDEINAVMSHVYSSPMMMHMHMGSGYYGGGMPVDSTTTSTTTSTSTP
jgi:hypothetical protein